MKKLSILLISLLLPITIYADNRVINGNDYNIYQKTKEQIASKWEIGKLDIPNNYYDIYETIPSYESPYKAGVVKQSYLNDVLDNLNYYRYLIGVPEISEYPENDVELQTAEVVQDYSLNEGFPLTHYLYDYEFTDPSNKPNDMTQEFYDLGAHAYHQIVAYGEPEEPNYFFFDESVYDPRNPTAGHRMALLGPEMASIQYGIGRSVIYGRIAYDSDVYNDMENDFAAYPAPGNFPKQDMADISDWDIFLNVYKFKLLNSNEERQVVVSIKNLTTGVIETRTIDDDNLTFDYYCQGNFCYPYYRLHIERPTKLTTYYEDNYEVYVENLIDSDNEYVDLKYTVNFYDKFEEIPSVISSVMLDLNLYLLSIDGEYQESIARAILKDMEADVALASGSVIHTTVDDFSVSNKFTCSGNPCYKYTPIITDLPDWAMDTNNILASKYLLTINYQDEENYRYSYHELSYTSTVSSSITLSITDYEPIYDGTAVYTWLKEKDGEFHELSDPEKYELSNEGLSLTINNLTKEDIGNYYLATILIPDRYLGNHINLSKPLSLSVSNPAIGITIDEEEATIDLSETYQMTAKMNPVDADDIITYIVSNDSIATVSNTGLVEPKKSGTVTITASVNGYSKTTIVTITNNQKGDMNDSGNIDLSDIIYLLKKYLGIEEITNNDIERGDMNNNSRIDLPDIIYLLKSYLGIN